MKVSAMLAALLVGWGISSQAAAQTPPPAADAKRIDELIKQLDSTRYVEREAASNELEKIRSNVPSASGMR